MQLKGLPPYLHIEKLHIEKACAQHSRLIFQAIIKPAYKDTYAHAINSHIGVIVYDEPVFFGIVQEVQVKESFSKIIVEVLAVSESIFTDEIRHKRIFQADKHKICDILSIKALKPEKCKLELDKELSNKEYADIPLQYEESNFNFIKRIADELNCRLWINDTIDGSTILKLGKNISDSICSFKSDDIIYSTLKKTRYTMGRIITSKKNAILGQMAQVENDSKKYIITSWQLDYVRARYEFTYELTEDKSIPQENVTDGVRHVELYAKVKSNDDPEHKGRLQILFLEDEGFEDVEKTKPRWMSFFTPYTGKEGGVVFVPDVDDPVDVVYNDGKCYITSAKRENTLSEEFKQVKDKFIGNNFKQRIMWKEKSLELLSDSNKIYMDKDKIELIVDKSKVIIDKEQIIMTAGKGKLILNNDGITFDGGGSKEALSGSGIEMSGNKLNIKASGNINISGSRINLA